MEKGDGTRKRALPACGIQGSNEKEQIPPERLCAPNACGRQGGEGWRGTPHLAARTHGVQPGTRGDPQTRQYATLVQGQGSEEEGGPPSQQRAQTAREQGREGDTSSRLCATTVHSLKEEEGGYPPERQRTHLMHDM